MALGFLSLSYADDVELTGHATGQKKYTKKPASEMQDDHLVLYQEKVTFLQLHYKGDGEAQIRQLSVLALQHIHMDCFFDTI